MPVSPIWTPNSDWNIGDAGKKKFFDEIFENTIANGYRLKILHTISASPASNWAISTLTYVPIGPNLTVGEFWENGSRLIGVNYLHWEISYTSPADGGGYIRLYNVTDAAAVTDSEVLCTGYAAWACVYLPAATSFSLVAGSKKYQIQYKAKVNGKSFNVDMVRLVAVMPIV
jgi:hypothetical protein